MVELWLATRNIGKDVTFPREAGYFLGVLCGQSGRDDE